MLIMVSKFRRSLRLSLNCYIAVAIAIAIFITACQSGISNQPSLKNRQVQSANCRVVEHTGGETKICGQPQKVVALEPKVLDLMLALDVQPFAYADAYLVRSPQFDHPSQQIPYLGNFVTNRPINLGDREQPSLERLASLKPDLILGVNSQNNSLLSTIAPAVFIDTTKPWQDNLSTVGQALNRHDKVQPVLGSQQQQLANVRTQLAPLINTHPRVLNVTCSERMDYTEIQYYGDLLRLLEEIGFQPTFLDGVERTPGLRKQISIETLAKLDADIIFVHTWLDHWDGTSAYTVPLTSLKQKWANNPLLHNSRTWQEGRVYFVDYTLWGGVISGSIADTLMLNQLPKLLLTPPSHS